MEIIGFGLLALIVIILLPVVCILAIVLFFMKKLSGKNNAGAWNSDSRQGASQTHDEKRSENPDGKIFSDDEGTYVNYDEVK